MQTSESSVAVACFLPGQAKDLTAPLYFRGNCYFVIRIDYLKYQYVSSDSMASCPIGYSLL